MKKLILISKLFVAFTTATDFRLKNLSSQCSLGGNSKVTFDYYPSNIDTLAASFSAGNCDIQQVPFNKIGTNTDESGNEYAQIELSYDPTTCAQLTDGATGLAAYSHSLQFSFDTGFMAAGQFLSMRSHIIPATCTYQSQYDLEYNFGQIQKKTDYGESDDNDPATAEVTRTEGGIDFDLFGYTDSDRTLLAQEGSLIAGQILYARIQPKNTLSDNWTYAPDKCEFIEYHGCDENGENCIIDDTFTLFDSTADQCPDAGVTDHLKFTLNYNSNNKNWNFEYMLFLFDTEVINDYKLKCNVKLCTTSRDSNGECNSVADSCLPDPSVFYSACPADETWNTTNEVCVNTATMELDNNYFGVDNKYRSLAEETFSFDDGQYLFEIRPFRYVNTFYVHATGTWEYVLGRGYPAAEQDTNPDIIQSSDLVSTEFLVMDTSTGMESSKMTNGDYCAPANAERDVTITFMCGSTNEVKATSYGTSGCSYFVLLQTPLAC